MELKKRIIIIFLILSNFLFLFGNKWTDGANNLLLKNNEPQIQYWLNFIIQNTKGTYETKNNTRIYYHSGFSITEYFANDNGKGAKSGIKSHTYEISFDKGNNIIFWIYESKIRLVFKNGKNEALYEINLTKKEIEYIYGDDNLKIQIEN